MKNGSKNKIAVFIFLFSVCLTHGTNLDGSQTYLSVSTTSISKIMSHEVEGT